MNQRLTSAKARVIFSLSSWEVVCMGVVFAFVLTPWFRQIEAMPTVYFVLRVVVAPIAITAPLASIIIFFGMAIFCVREDRSRGRVRLSWIILFLMAGPFGAAIYYFRVYRKQVRATRVTPDAD